VIVYTYIYIHTTMASAFNLLTSGGARFDKNRFKKDIELFTGVSPLSPLIPSLLH